MGAGRYPCTLILSSPGLTLHCHPPAGFQPVIPRLDRGTQYSRRWSSAQASIAQRSKMLPPRLDAIICCNLVALARTASCMTRDETIALFLKGKDAWNAWAEDMLAQRKALEDSGQWQISPGNSVEHARSNPETANWLALACADFSNIEMTGKKRPNSSSVRLSKNVSGANVYELNMDQIDFSGFIFPANVSFENSVFHIKTYFSDCQFYGSSNFVGTKFAKSVTFHNGNFWGFCTFNNSSIDGVDFSNVVFHRSAKFKSAFLRISSDFRNCAFRGTAQFNRCCFAETDFGRVKFFGPTSFSKSQFDGEALFRRAMFLNGTLFEQAVFHGFTSFFEANFEKSVSFDKAKFENNVSFKDLTILNEARFLRSPV